MFSRLRFALYVAAVTLGATALAHAAVGQSGPPKGAVTPETIPNNVISACVNKTTGALREVASSSQCVLATEVFTQWNIKGTTGATGPVGPAGAKGNTGPA